MSNLYIEDLARCRVGELLREAQHDQLVDLATGPGRPLRARVAEWLFALAERVEGTHSGTFVQSRTMS